MGYVFRSEDVLQCEEWFRSDAGRLASLIEEELLLRLWAPSSSQRVLEVGCGAGFFLDWLLRHGHSVSGIDPSSPMLEAARRRLGNNVPLDQGYAENLPYDDNEFDTVALLTSLEYVEDPLRALEEAFRVARRHVLLGALNKYSLITVQRYAERLWKRSYFNHAQFYGVFQLHRLVEEALSGSVPVRWRTCLFFPLSTLSRLYRLERSPFFHWHPFGHFIGMRVDILYPLQTVRTPLFCDMPRGMTRQRVRASSWRFPLGNGFSREFPAHQTVPKSRGAKEMGTSVRPAL